MELSLLKRLNAEREARRGAVVVTDLASGRQRLVTESGIAGDPLETQIAEALRSGRSGLVAGEQGEAFLNVQAPPARIVVIGAVHISQALVPLARIAGFDIEVVDPRTAFATPERFPDAVLVAEWPELVFRSRPLDPYTALVVLTHDPKIDDLPLGEALAARCFYIGALGSRKTHARRIERLTAAGSPREELDRIEGPVGLAIGAATPAEIAVSILASIIRALRQRAAVATARSSETASK